MKTLVKLAVASAVVFGASAAMAVCDTDSDLGITGEDSECCVYDYNKDVVSGYLLDVNTTVGDSNTTIKCAYKPEKIRGKKADRPAVVYYSTDPEEGKLCNTLNVTQQPAQTGVWTNVVSSAGIVSLVCKYSPPAP